jgi:pimeloyl-ACP methyl ester carboxylesterase
MTKGGFRSVYVTAKDGLKLHLREYGERDAPGLPIVCLPGLTRASIDFHPLAYALAHDPARPRRVLALDYRGRGLSDYDPDPTHYTVAIELEDVLSVLTACAAEPAVFVGTSRGGIITMTLGAVRPTAIAGVVLNDIGPVIDMPGLLRIKDYVGRLPQPKDFAEGVDILRVRFAVQYPKFTEKDWLAAARRTWREDNGKLVLTYDPALAQTLDGVDADTPLPTMWPLFDSLADIPLMVIRGALSDLFSPATVAEMRARRKQFEFLEVPDQGHAPLLIEPEVIARIAAFVDDCAGRSIHA